MTTKSVARCSIYASRPEMCREYPTIGHYVPPECTFYFNGVDRQGDCSCDVGACCSIPRVDGEPGGAPMPEIAGGQPCKHLEWVEEQVKTANPALTVLDDRRESAHAIQDAVSGDEG